MRCPKCNSENVQKKKMVHKMGTSTSTGAGVGTAGVGVGVGISSTKLAEETAYTQEYSTETLVRVAVALAIGVAAYFFTDSFWIALGATVVTAGVLELTQLGKVGAKKDLAHKMAYDRSWICLACGEAWTENQFDC